MSRILLLFTAISLSGTAAQARQTVDASAPVDLAVTLYRDPDRGAFEAMNPDWPQGFAMITETRTVELPPGESTIRFAGVAEGMVAVSAIVSGLPGGTIEKNRNADLLSPAALVDGTLGNRVTITRTNLVTGQQESETAVVRTRADGGLVLQTGEGFEAVRCSGIPEKLTFSGVPEGLSAKPIYSIDTSDRRGGTYTVQLTYLAWGFDWQANYVARLEEGGGQDMNLRLMSWLTLLNDNGQSFPNAELLVVAGKLNVESDFEILSNPPVARPLRLTCYPIGSTAAGSPVHTLYPPPPSPPPPPAPPSLMAEVMQDAPQSITVSGARSKAAMVAVEEDLGDLKLYRVPERVMVSAKGLKQVAFLDKDEVKGRLVYEADCAAWNSGELPQAAQVLIETVNDRKHGLGVALPTGGIVFFESSPAGDLFVGEQRLPDRAEGQDVKIEVGQSSQVSVQCNQVGNASVDEGWVKMQVVATNANPSPITLRLKLGQSSQWKLRGLGGAKVKDGELVHEFTLPANVRRKVDWATMRL